MSPIEVVVVVFGALGMIGSISVIATSIMIPELRKQLSRGRALVLLLSGADLAQGVFFTLTAAVDTDEGSTSCFVWGSFGILASVASFIATAWVSWWVHYTLVNREPTGNILLFPIFTTLAYPLLTLASLLIYASHEFGDDWRTIFSPTQHFPWCFVTEHPSRDMLIWRIVIEYGPLLVSMVVTAYYYLKAIWYLKKQAILQCAEDTPEMIYLKRKLLLIAAAYLIVRFPGVIARVITMVASSGEVWPWLRFFVGVGDPSQGLVNGLIFTFGTQIVRNRIKGACSCCNTQSGPYEQVPSTPVSIVIPTERPNKARVSTHHLNLSGQLRTQTVRDSLLDKNAVPTSLKDDDMIQSPA
eukprot:TRINITY_DN21632_c0_g1_i1.p1 TRINITY_DN21632_c0_g1~~TRINITY_DN21632_c0_g1_i1.p1  ORF type:complete len:356 (+),score=29.98 TRINITY_DN21632_c0_g1_i1:82-1149(+)